MGISDRDYIRRAPPTPGRYGRGGPSAVRMWSVNTWLIVICVGVYVIDSFAPRTEFWFQPVAVSRELPRHIEVAAGQQYREIPGAKANELRALQTGRMLFKRDMYDVSAVPPELVGSVLFEWMPPLKRWLYFSTDRAFRKLEVWRFVGFQFLHGSRSHLLFNMLGLFFFGAMVERYLGSKRYLAFYLLCGILGAVMYLVLNLGGVVASLMAGKPIAPIPGLLFDSTATPLIGASAGVFGVLMAGAYLAPNALVLLFFILPMRLKTLAYLLVAIAFFTVVGNGANAGGEAGHLGGALGGFYFIRRPHHLHGFFDILGRLDPTSHHYRRKGRTATGRRSAQTEQIDRILAKISAEGLQSLTESEKRALREASDRR